MSIPEHTATGLSVAKTEELLAEKRGEHDAAPVPRLELEGLRKDAERYRWLRKEIRPQICIVATGNRPIFGRYCDVVVDHLRKTIP